MAGFARYVYFIPGGVVSLLTIGVVFPQVGGVALGTHVVPVLGDMGPVKDIIGRNMLILVDMIPALSAHPGRTGVPADGEALVPSPGECNKVLLQGPDSKNIGDLVVEHLAIRSFGIYHVLSIFRIEPGSDSEMGVGDITEITQHGLCYGRVHGLVMIRSLKKIILFFMALLTALTTYVFSP